MAGGPIAVREADSDQYVVQFAGVNLAQGSGQSGWTDGEFLTCEQVKDSFMIVEGTDGSLSRSKSNTRLLSVKIVFAQTGVRNALLSAVIASGENGVNGADIGSFLLKDLQGTTLVVASRMWVVKRPTIALDRTSKERAWMFHGAWDTFLVGGNL